jgi:heme exporter protein D
MIELLTKIGIPGKYAGDVWLAVVFLVVSLALILLVKKKNLGAILVSIYVAYAVLTKAFFDFLENQNLKLIFFLALIFFLFQIFQRFFRMGVGGGRVVMWAKVISIALSIVGLLVSVVLQWFSAAIIQEFFSPLSLGLFLSEPAQFVWMLVPLALIFLLIQKRY